jgi:hypothetical protein
MSLEWPDFEAEYKKKIAKSKKKPAQDFIVSDSDSDVDDLRPKRKRRKECESCLPHQYGNDLLTLLGFSWFTFPS